MMIDDWFVGDSGQAAFKSQMPIADIPFAVAMPLNDYVLRLIGLATRAKIL